MQRRVRRETKAAARELRKDSFFLAGVRQERWRAERRAIDKRENQIIGLLAGQQGELNAMDKPKKQRVGKAFNAAD